MASFAERLRELRIDKGVGQKEVGAIINVSDSSIRKYESGERTPAPEALLKLADFFGVTVDYLLGRENSSSTPQQQKMPKDLLKIIEQEDFVLNGRMATPEDRERLIKMYEVMYWDAKEKNKRKK